MKIRESKIAPTLTLSVGFLVLLAVGLVLYVQWNASRKIMTDLAGRVVIRNLEVVSQGISGHLDPVRNQVEYLADLVEDGVYELDAEPTCCCFKVSRCFQKQLSITFMKQRARFGGVTTTSKRSQRA